MSSRVHSLPDQTQIGSVSAADATGAEFTKDEAITVQIAIGTADVADLLSVYNQADSSSPDATTAREVARAVLDALKAFTS